MYVNSSIQNTSSYTHLYPPSLISKMSIVSVQNSAPFFVLFYTAFLHSYSQEEFVILSDCTLPFKYLSYSSYHAASRLIFP